MVIPRSKQFLYFLEWLIFKKNENFDDLFLGRPNWFFSELSYSSKKFWKTGQKAVFEHFLEKFDENLLFFGARSPSKLVYFGAKGAFRKILGSIDQKWIS